MDGRTDLYALGATLYLLLSGQVPFNGPARPEPTPVEQLRPEAEGELAGIVRRALAHEPADRFPSATAMLAALRPFAPSDLRVAVPLGDPEPSLVRGVSSTSGNAGPPLGGEFPARRSASKARNPVVVALAGVLVVALIGLVTAAALVLPSRNVAATPTPAIPQTELLKLPAPATWPVLKNDLTGMTYVGDDAFATWSSTLENGILTYQMTSKNGAAYPVPIGGRDVGQSFHYAVSAKQVSGAPSSYGLVLLYPFGAKAADASTEYYEFVIDNNLNARFALRSAGAWKTVWQASSVSAVKPGDTNVLVVHAEGVSGGTHFTLFLNGRYVTDVIDDQLRRPGAVGLLVVLDDPGTTATWEFSNLELRAPPSSS